MSKNWEQEARQLKDRCNQLRRQPEKVESDLTQEDVAGVTADFKACLAERNEAREQRDALQALEGGWTARQAADYLAMVTKDRQALEAERDEARAELAQRKESAKSLILDGPFTFDASNDVAALKAALTEAKGIFDRQVKYGALKHSDWDRMASIASGNLTAALHGRGRMLQVFEETEPFGGNKTPASKCPICQGTDVGSNGLPCARIH